MSAADLINWDARERKNFCNVIEPKNCEAGDVEQNRCTVTLQTKKDPTSYPGGCRCHCPRSWLIEAPSYVRHYDVIPKRQYYFGGERVWR